MVDFLTRVFLGIIGGALLSVSVVIFVFMLAHGAWFLAGDNAFSHAGRFFLAMMLAKISDSVGEFSFRVISKAFDK